MTKTMGPLQHDDARAARAICRRVFADDWAQGPFRQKDWVIVPVAGPFGPPEPDEPDEWLPRGNHRPCLGPQSGGWPQRGDLPDIHDYTDPFFWCMKKLGRETCLLSFESHPLHRVRRVGLEFERGEPIPEDQYDPEWITHFRTTFNYPSFGTGINVLWNARPEGWSFDSDEVVFDDHGDWGITDWAGELHVLGGTPAFMQTYFDVAGGEDFVRAWFYHWELWNITDYNTTDLFDLVGWPEPVMPEGGLWAGYPGDIDWTPMFGDRIKSCGPAVIPPKEETPQP